MEKSADEVLQEKRSERGWDQEDEMIRHRDVEPVEPLPLTNEEYQVFQSILRKLALYEKKPELCDLYFELDHRATYGNHYPQSEGVEDIEQELWDIGSSRGEIETIRRK